jgi:CheY-like chemotaxis protein
MAAPVVLVIEDKDDVREGIAALLMEHGYRTIAAEDGAHALALLDIAATQPSLILLDVVMPTMDGLEFRRKLLAERPELADIPIVVVTALPYDARVVRQFSGTTYLAKPFDPRKLIELVDHHCNPRLATRILHQSRPHQA